MKIELLPVESITPYARNPRKNSGVPVAKIKASLKEFGWQQPIVVDVDKVIIAGHTRYLAALELGLKEIPVHIATNLTSAQVKAYRIADNRTAQEAQWDMELLNLEIQDLKELDFNLDLTGFDPDELAGIELGGEPVTEGDTDSESVEARQTMSERFGIPPFSVLNAREGWWQARKQAWIAMGIQSELGRGGSRCLSDERSGELEDGNLRIKTHIGEGADMGQPGNQRKRAELLPQPNATPGGSLMPAMNYSARQRGDGRGRPL